MADGSEHITLDRTNLLRLADAIDTALPAIEEWDDRVPEIIRKAFRDGWHAACESMRAMAVEMPHLYGNGGCPVERP